MGAVRGCVQKSSPDQNQKGDNPMIGLCMVCPELSVHTVNDVNNLNPNIGIQPIDGSVSSMPVNGQKCVCSEETEVWLLKCSRLESDTRMTSSNSGSDL